MSNESCEIKREIGGIKGRSRHILSDLRYDKCVRIDLQRKERHPKETCNIKRDIQKRPVTSKESSERDL